MMKKINEIYQKKHYPIRIMQFGEGNFLRGFLDYGVDIANEKADFKGSVAIIKPRPGNLNRLQAQDGIYTVVIRGIKDGKLYDEKRVVTCVEKLLCAYEDYNEFMNIAEQESLEFIVSNTTEAGIVFDATNQLAECPPQTYPAKLTKFLYKRFEYYNGAADKGLVILPLELSDKNGDMLKKYVADYAKLWGLKAEFTQWLENCNIFANTLVDRIVTGYPADADELMGKWGYEDKQIVACEPFALWVIGDERIARRLPISSGAFKLEFTNDIAKFKEQKVRILNGAHTAIALGAYLSGKNYVRECMEDKLFRTYIEQLVLREIVPTVAIPTEQAEQFARFVFERFANPFIQHELLAIALNSVSKWRVRILPTLKDCYRLNRQLPEKLTFSFAALAAFYRAEIWREGCLVGKRGEEVFKIADNEAVLRYFQKIAGKTTAEYVKLLAANCELWGEDLTCLPGFTLAVTEALAAIEKDGVSSCIRKMIM